MAKHNRFLALISAIAAALLLTGCATTSKKTASRKHSYTDIGALIIGKTTPAECRAMFGDPKSTRTETGGEGKFELYRYAQLVRGPSKGFARILLVEFKDGTLNGFAAASSFPEDRSTFPTANLPKVEFATSTKVEVQQLLGKPQGRMRCPTKLFGGASRCKASGREMWIYEDFHPVRLPLSGGERRTFTGSGALIVFDDHNLVTDISSSEHADY